MAVALAGGLALAAAGSLAALLALIPFLAGDEVGSGYSRTGVGLCALDPEGTFPLLIAGDSRAKFQISPALLSERLGLPAVNVADAYTTGGDLPTLANSLKRNPVPLARRPSFVISVSYRFLDDLDPDATPLAGLFNWRLRDHLRLAYRAPGRYFPFLARRFLPALKRTLLHRWRGDDFVCRSGERPYYPAREADSLGYVANPEGIAATFKEEVPGRAYLMDGGNWRAFRMALAWLARSGAARIALVNAPLDPRWRAEYPASPLQAAEKSFSDSLATLADPHPDSGSAPIRILDFYRHPLDGLDPSCFLDRSHLNPQGARLFTSALADSLQRIWGVGKTNSVGHLSARRQQE